jgi:NMT1-like family
VAAAVAAVSDAGHGPAIFIPVNEAKAMEQLAPAVEALTVPRGAYGGAPPIPASDVETIAGSVRLLARSDVRDSLVGEVARVLFTERPAIAAIAPLANRMEAPVTDRGASLPVHPGAAAYIDGDEETFLDKYSDFIYIGAMLLSVLASAAAALMSRLDSVRRLRVEDLIGQLLRLLVAVRVATTSKEIDAMEADVDRILADALAAENAPSMEAHRVTALGLALEHLRHALRDRRAQIEREDAKRSPTARPRLMSGG